MTISQEYPPASRGNLRTNIKNINEVYQKDIRLMYETCSKLTI